MSDYGDIIQTSFGQRNPALPLAVGNLDEDPDKAQRALDLAKATGVPSTAIYGDLDEFERQHKAMLASDIVANNPHLGDFIQSDPMVPKIANDDYGNLDSVSQKVTGLGLKPSGFSAWLQSDSIAKGAARGFGDESIGGMFIQPSPEHRLLTSVAAAGLTVPELALRGVNAAIYGLSYGLLGEEQGEKAAQVVTDPALQASLQGLGPAGSIVGGIEGLLSKVRPAALFVKHGREIPPTVLPEYDQFRAKQNADDVGRLKEATGEAQQSLTRERSPELFKQFISQHTDAEIGVGGDAVAALYGDKVPTADDGLLGWVPNIESKLALARASGDDVSIPISAWLTHVEPEVMTALHDDIRVRAGGITANEAKLGAEVEAGVGPSTPLPEEVPMIRAASALEPLLSIGDRKLQLQRMKDTGASQFGPAQGFHDFDLMDEKGNTVGTINLSEQKGGKELYIDMINGVNGLGARDFGPALMRDLFRQLRAEFPNAETLGGHRVSGARDRFNTYNEPHAMWKLPMEKFETPEGVNDLYKALEGGQWEAYSSNIQAYIKPFAERSVDDRNLINMVNDTLQRIVPQKLNVQAVDRIVAKGVEGQRGEAIEPTGAYIKYRQAYPMMLYALDRNNPLKTPLHESTHHLWDYGFYNKDERFTLLKAAQDNGWLNQFNIKERYPNLNLHDRLIESIADSYSEWEQRRLEVSPEVHTIFERMKAFFDTIKQRIGELLGKEPTWEDIFKKVSTGEVGSREGTTPLDVRAFNEKLAINEERNAPKAANDVDVKGLERAPTYEAAAKSQTIERYVTKDTERGDFQYWKNIAKKEQVQIEGTEMGNANAFIAARGHSEGGKTTLVIGYDGRRTVFHDGVKEVRESRHDLDAKLSAPEEPEGGSRVFERATALGMTAEQFKQYDELIQKRHQEDIAAATKRAQDQQAREHTKQWKADRKDLRAEVAESIKQRPDVAADLFFGSGELYGKKVPLGSVKMDASALTDAQKAGLPRQYYGEHGIHPDEVASIFGYGSGDAMVEKLIQYNAAKLKAGGMSAKDFVSRVTDVETDRQMQIKHGMLENNIMDAVKEQVVGETQLNILAEETHALGMKIGQGPLNTANIVNAVQQELAKVPRASISSDRYMATAGRAGKAAELALLNNDPAAAFQAKQRQYYATVMAREAVQIEKELGKFNKTAKPFAKVFDPKSGAVIDADYSLRIRQILSQVERPYGMSVQGLEKALGESDYSSLKDFVEQTERLHSLEGLELPIADYLLDPTFHKNFDELTVEEFRGLNQSITALNHLGRSVRKVEIAGEKADRKDWIKQAHEQLAEKFDPQDFGAAGKPGAVRHYLAALTNLETLFARFDGRDPDGIFTKMFTYPAARAANNKEVLLKDFAKDFDKAGPIKDPKRKVESPLIDPLTGKPLTDFTRENVATIISNMGNEYNWRVFTKGWKIDPDVLWKWVEKNSTPEDFARAQAVGKVFNKGKNQSDIVYKNIYNVSPESIQVRPFTMHGINYEGWYHPIVYDPIRSKLSKLQSADPAGPGHSNFWPSPSNAYTKRRTGAVDVISLSQDMVPIKLNQMLHDIAFREFVHNTAKITRDDGFRGAVTERYGPEYVSTIDTWLERIAGNASYNSDAVALATRLSSQLRSNVVSTYIAFSATTVEKHGFTAAVMSAKEVGATKFARITAEVAANSFKHAVMDLFGRSADLGESLWQFARRNSEEIQRRDKNFQETLGGQHDLALGRSTLRDRIIQIGSKGVAFSDMLSAIPLWLAKYRDVMEGTGDAGRATDQADRAVRRAHGSTAITNQPTIVSNTGPLAPWLTTIYGFFGTNMQRRLEIAHDINDAYKLARGGEIKLAASMMPEIMSSIFTYVIWPGLVEEAVSSQFYEDKSKGGVIGHALAFTLGTAASTFIGIRDLAYGLLHGREPQVGLLSSPLHDVEQLLRDVKKDKPINKHNAGKLVQDAITVFGDARGLGPKHVGTALRYGIDVLTKEQRPKTAGDVYRGVISGKQEKTIVH